MSEDKKTVKVKEDKIIKVKPTEIHVKNGRVVPAGKIKE